MFSTRTSRGLLAHGPTPQEDRELLRLALSGSTLNGARLWQLHPEIFEHGGSPAELPPGSVWAALAPAHASSRSYLQSVRSSLGRGQDYYR